MNFYGELTRHYGSTEAMLSMRSWVNNCWLDEEDGKAELLVLSSIATYTLYTVFITGVLSSPRFRRNKAPGMILGTRIRRMHVLCFVDSVTHPITTWSALSLLLKFM